MGGSFNTCRLSQSWDVINATESVMNWCARSLFKVNESVKECERTRVHCVLLHDDQVHTLAFVKRSRANLIDRTGGQTSTHFVHFLPFILYYCFVLLSSLDLPLRHWPYVAQTAGKVLLALTTIQYLHVPKNFQKGPPLGPVLENLYTSIKI